MEKIDIRSEIRGDKEDGSWVFHIQVNDQSLIGKEFRFCLVRTVNVLVSRGIDESDTLYETKFPLTSNMHTVEISAKQYPCYSYQGESISISVSAQCEVDDAIIFDSKIDHEIDLPIEHKTKIQSAALDLVGLADSFSFRKNFQIIPAKNKFAIITALILAIPLVFLNVLLVIHDLFAGQALFYNIFSFIWGLAGSGICGAIIFYSIKLQLKKYMTFTLKTLPDRIDHNTRLRVSDMITGVSRIPLQNIVVRVIACNMESGQYMSGSGTKERTVGFSNPCRRIVLYEKSVTEILPNIDFGHYFLDEIDFSKMFANLYPPQLASAGSGLDIYWEIRLIHPEFVDWEITCPTEQFHYQSFVRQIK